MRRSLAIYRAYLVRDALLSASYRLAFAIQVLSLAFSVLSFYFIARLVGDHPSLARYGGYLPFAVVGFAMTSYFTTGFSSFAESIRNEQMMGTLESLLMTPARLRDLVIGSSLWNFIWTTMSTVAMIAAAWWLFDLRFTGHYVAAAALLLLTTATFSCLGIISAGYVMVFKRGDPLKFLVGTVSFLIGGVVYPVELLPGWVQKLAALLPITHGLHGIRELMLAGAPPAAVWPQAGVLLAFLAAGIPVSLWVFRRAVDLARREGSLVHY